MGALTLSILVGLFTFAFLQALRRYLYIQGFKARYKFPGPAFYFGVGSAIEVFQLINLRSAEVCKWFKQKYGDYAAYFMGEHFVVFMNDYNKIRKTLQAEDLDGRIPPHAVSFKNYYNKNLGILLAMDETASRMRSFATRHLRKLGFGSKGDMTLILHRELVDFTRAIDAEREKNGNWVSLFDFICRSQFSAFWSYLAGESFPVQQKDLVALCDALFVQDELTNFGKSIEWYIPSAGYIPWISDFKKLTKSHDTVKEFFKRVIREKLKTGTYKEDPKDFIDFFIKEIEDKPDPYFHMEQLEMMCNDLLLGGILTTANSIMWGIYWIMRTPRVYQTLMLEIDEVVGMAFPNIERDLQNMPYVQAIINEIFRMEVAVPVTSRTNSKPTTLMGYPLPAQSMVILDLDGPNKDPTLWDKPELFYPERFLDENNHIKHFDHFIPFGTGRRMCIGEKAVRVSVFYHIINFFQNYDYIVPGDIKRIDGISNNAAPFDVYLTEREGASKGREKVMVNPEPILKDIKEEAEEEISPKFRVETTPELIEEAFTKEQPSRMFQHIIETVGSGNFRSRD